MKQRSPLEQIIWETECHLIAQEIELEVLKDQKSKLNSQIILEQSKDKIKHLNEVMLSVDKGIFEVSPTVDVLKLKLLKLNNRAK